MSITPQPHHRRRMLTAAAVTLAMAFTALPADAAIQTASKRTAKKKAVPNFSVRFLGDERNVAAGSTASYTFRLTSTAGFRGGVVFDVSDLPPGVTSKITTLSSTSFRLDVSTTTSTLGGSAVYALRGRSGNLVRTALFRLTVVAAPTTTQPGVTTTAPVGDFTVATDVPTLTLTPGDTGALSVNITRLLGFSAPVTFKLEGLPANVEAAFAPNPTQANAKLYIAPATNAPSGTYLLVITATSGNLVRSAAARLVIRRVGPFTMTLSPATVTAPQGIDATTTVTVAPTSGTLVPDVLIDISAAPPGVTVLTPETTGRSTKFTLRTSASTAPGTYNFNIVGRSGTFTQTVALQLVVTANVPGFGLSAQPVTQTAARGGTATYNVTAVNTGGFNGPIAYAVTGLPAGARAEFSPAANGVVVRVITSEATAPTTYVLQITGKSGTLTSTVPVTLVVTAPATAPTPTTTVA